MPQEQDFYAEGVQRQGLGDLTGAEAYLAQVGPEQDAYTDAQLRLARLWLDTDRPALADSAARRVLAEEQSAAAWSLLGEALAAQGEHAEAEAAFGHAARLDATSPDPCILAGHAHVAAGAFAAGIRAYEQAVLRDARHVAARYFLAEALVRAGDIVRASTQLHYVQHLQPTYVPAILLRGDIAFHQKDYRQAIVEYCQAIATDEVDADVYQRLGQAFLAIEDADQALKAYEKVLQRDPEAWGAHLAVAQLYEAKKQMTRARRHYAAVAFLPDCCEAATAGLARVDAYLAMFDLGEKPAEPTPPPAAAEEFQAPEVLRRSPGTRPLGVRPAGTRPLGAPPPETRPLPKPPIPPRRSPGAGPLPGTKPLPAPPKDGLRSSRDEPGSRPH